MEDGVEKPYLLKDGTPGPWSKGFICQEGLVCQVRIYIRRGDAIDVLMHKDDL